MFPRNHTLQMSKVQQQGRKKEREKEKGTDIQTNRHTKLPADKFEVHNEANMYYLNMVCFIKRRKSATLENPKQIDIFFIGTQSFIFFLVYSCLKPSFLPPAHSTTMPRLSEPSGLSSIVYLFGSMICWSCRVKYQLLLVVVQIC